MTEQLAEVADAPEYPALFGGDTSVFSACRSALRPGSADKLDALVPLWHDAIAKSTRPTSSGISGEYFAAIECIDALVDLTKMLRSGTGTKEAVHSVCGAWERALILPTSGPVGNPPEAFFAHADPRAVRLMHAIAGDDPKHAHSLAVLFMASLCGFLPSGRKEVRIPVLFDRESVGESGDLRLSLVPGGPPGLYPDPRSMSLFTADERFQASLTAAWCGAHDDAGERCVIWSVQSEGAACDHIEDSSLGGAFAVGLDELMRKARHFGRLRRIRTLDSDCAVSAALDEDMQLLAVGGVKEKLDAAGAAGWRVVLPKATQTEVEALGTEARARVDYAGTAREAIDKTRTAINRAIIAIAVAVVVAVVATGVAVRMQMAASHERQRTALLRTVDELREIAAATGDRSVRDLSLQSLLLLAGSDLAREAGEPELANDILNDITEIRSGRLNTLSLDIGPIVYLEDVAGGVIAGSISGHISFIDPGLDKEIGAFSEAPGIENPLVQRRVTTVAEHPLLDAFAVVLQAGPTDRSDVVLLSSQSWASATNTEPLEVFDRLTVPGNPVRALAYKPSGEYLVGVSKDEVTRWRVFDRDRGLGTLCSLASSASDTGSTEPTDVIMDPASDDPLVVFEDGRVVRLDDIWSLPPLTGLQGPCAATEVLPANGAEFVAARATGDEILVATANRSELGVRSTGDRPPVSFEIEDGAPIEAIELRPDGEAIAVARNEDDVSPEIEDGAPIDAIELRPEDQTSGVAGNGDIESVVETYEISGKLDATFGGYRAPLTYTSQGLLALDKDGRKVDVLSDDATVTFRGVSIDYDAFVRGGHQPFWVRAGRDAFAATGPGSSIGVYPLVDDTPSNVIKLPQGWSVYRGGFFGENFDVSDDGRLVAVTVVNEDIEGSERASLWDVERGLELELPEGPAVKEQWEAIPIGVRFLPDDDALLVGYAGGEVVRLDRTHNAWRTTLLREGRPGQALGSIEVIKDRFVALELDENIAGGWFQRVVTRSLENGNVLDEWEVTDLGLNLGAPVVLPSFPYREGGGLRRGWMIPVSDGSVLLGESGGSVYRLHQNGNIQGPLILDIGDIHAGTELPDSGTVILASANGTTVVVDIDRLVRDTRTSPYGPMAAIAATRDGQFLVGVSFPHALAAIVPLQGRDQRADLCATARRELTHDEWSNYVGEIASYRELCDESLQYQRTMQHIVQEIESAVPATVLRNPSITQSEHLERFCDPIERSPWIIASALEEISWAVATEDDLGYDAAGVVCVDDSVRWVIPSAPPSNEGGDPRQITFIPGSNADEEPVVGVARYSVPQDGSGPVLRIDVVGADGRKVGASLRRGSIDDLLTDRLRATYQAESIVVSTTYSPADASSRWNLRRQLPSGSAFGRAESATPADITAVLGAPSPAFDSNPFGALGHVRALVESAAGPDGTRLAVIIDDSETIATAQFRRAEDHDSYELVAWSADNSLICRGDPERIKSLDEEVLRAARCDITADDLVLTARGLGALQLGMTNEDAARTGLIEFNSPTTERASAQCATATARFPLPQGTAVRGHGVAVRFDDGVLTSITVTDTSTPVHNGLRVWSGRDEVIGTIGVPDRSEDDLDTYVKDGWQFSFRYDPRLSRVMEIIAGEVDSVCLPDS